MTALKEWRDAMDDVLFPLSSDAWHVAISTYYRNYVRSRVLTPGVVADVSPIGLDGNPSLKALYFPYPCPNPCVGTPIGDHLLLAGGTGWFISAYELARFSTRLRQGLIISPSSVNKIFNVASPADAYIFNNTFESSHGTIFCKVGAIKNTKGILFQFPDHVQLALVSNSDAPSATIRDLIRSVYENSWILKKT